MENLQDLRQKYARVGVSDYVSLLFAKRAAHRERKEGPILGNVPIAITNCITNRWLLNIYYQGDKELSPGRRWIECYVWGLNKFTSNNVLRAWQLSGVTTTDQPGWKLFRLDRIRNTAVLSSKTFNKPRILYNPFDEDMSTIFMSVTFPDQ